jgi:hypothetical protein
VPVAIALLFSFEIVKVGSREKAARYIKSKKKSEDKFPTKF